MFTTKSPNTRGVLALLLLSCLLIQTTYAGWELLIKSDGSGESFSGKKAYTVSADRFRDFPYSGVVGVWSRDPKDAKDGEKVTLLEEFSVSCGSRLRLWVMGDDEFVAKINGKEVLKGNNWEELKKTTIDISDAKYGINRCGAGVNKLTIEGKNSYEDASIAYTLEEDTTCKDCTGGQEFNNDLCRCSEIIAPLVEWNYLETPISIYDHSLDFSTSETNLTTTTFPEGAKPKQILISVYASYLRNTQPKTKNTIKFYQDHKANNDQADDKLQYIMMLYKRDNTISTTNFHYDVQQTFPLMLASKKNLNIKLESPVSADSQLNLDIIGWR